MRLTEGINGKGIEGISQVDRVAKNTLTYIGHVQGKRKIPKHEMFGLTSQIRRAAVSIESNIAEGYALGTAPNYLRHLNISVGSLAEVECQTEIAHDLHYMDDTDYTQLMELAREAGYLLSRLKASIERNTSKKT